MYYPLYPQPLLGDFGLAFFSRYKDVKTPANPDYYQGLGTPGFIAPEMLNQSVVENRKEVIKGFKDRTNNTTWELNQKTNVFGIGLILWCLIHLKEGPPQSKFRKGDNDDTLQKASARSITYSPELQELVQDCCKFRREDRPTLQALRERIYNLLLEDGRDIAAKMASGAASEAAQAQHKLAGVDEGSVKYKKGMTWSEIHPDGAAESQDDDAKRDEDNGNKEVEDEGELENSDEEPDTASSDDESVQVEESEYAEDQDGGENQEMDDGDDEDLEDD